MLNAIKSTALMIATVSLWGCAPIDHTHKPPVVGQPVERFDDFELYIAGKPIQDFFRDREALINQLDIVAKQDPDIDLENEDNLKLILEGIRNKELRGDNVPKSFRSIEGFSTISAFRLAILGELSKTKGKIRDFIFDKNKKNGHISVDTRTEIFKDLASYRKEVPDSIVFRHWDIDVDGYAVIPHSENDDDPFPDTVTFPPNALGPEGSIKKRGLDHKLYAKGKGVVVRHVYERIDDGPLVRLPEGDAVYLPSDDSCVDIMFAGEPPETYSEFPPSTDAGLAYCLGRCKEPDIVNTD